MTDGIPVDAIDGIGPKKKELFRRIGAETLEDLLRCFPAGYRDFRKAVPVAELEDGESALIECRVLYGAGTGAYRRNRGRMFRFSAGDDSGKLDVVFFNAGYLASQFRKGDVYWFYGQVRKYGGRLTMTNPEYFRESEFRKEIVPVYHTVRGLSQKEIKKCIGEAFRRCADSGFFQEIFPAELIEKRNLCSAEFMYRNLHNPAGRDAFAMARYRQIYEEMFALEMALADSGMPEAEGPAMPYEDGEYLKLLGFEMTGDQKKAATEIWSDMSSGRRMNRLLQGDVGSGKTAVGELAVYKAVLNGYQAAFMVPTEILAKQHYNSIKRKMNELGYRTVLLTGSLRASERKNVYSMIASGEADLIIGTHALIQEEVEFARLGLVITDEQHRFGVNQRMKLGDKGINPHILVMTATPIPRTLAVIFYKNMDISVIREMPKGRKPVITEKVTEKGRNRLYDMMAEAAENGEQVYVVAPLIEESDFFEGVRSAEELFAEIKERFGSRLSVGLVHGNMKQKDKDDVMESFRKGEISVLVSTVVIEVGVDVPDATMMIIENAERFGLAQLHQLRGRVGRGSRQSRCFLVSAGRGEVALKRFEIMCRSTDGFEIAEQDLKLRGPGEIFGIRQHGVPDSCLVNIVKHKDLYDKVSEDAREFYDIIEPEVKNRLIMKAGGIMNPAL